MFRHSMFALIAVLLLKSGGAIAQTSYSGTEDQRIATLQAKVPPLERKRAALVLEKAKVRQELLAGRYCSECSRSETELRARGEAFDAHLKRVNGTPKAAPADVIADKMAEYDARIADIDAEIERIQDQIANLREAKDTRLREAAERREAARRDAEAKKREKARRELKETQDFIRRQQEDAQRNSDDINSKIGDFFRNMQEDSDRQFEERQAERLRRHEEEEDRLLRRGGRSADPDADLDEGRDSDSDLQNIDPAAYDPLARQPAYATPARSAEARPAPRPFAGFAADIDSALRARASSGGADWGGSGGQENEASGYPQLRERLLSRWEQQDAAEPISTPPNLAAMFDRYADPDPRESTVPPQLSRMFDKYADETPEPADGRVGNSTSAPEPAEDASNSFLARMSVKYGSDRPTEAGEPTAADRLRTAAGDVAKHYAWNSTLSVGDEGEPKATPDDTKLQADREFAVHARAELNTRMREMQDDATIRSRLIAEARARDPKLSRDAADARITQTDVKAARSRMADENAKQFGALDELERDIARREARVARSTDDDSGLKASLRDVAKDHAESAMKDSAWEAGGHATAKAFAGADYDDAEVRDKFERIGIASVPRSIWNEFKSGSVKTRIEESWNRIRSIRSFFKKERQKIGDGIDAVLDDKDGTER